MSKFLEDLKPEVGWTLRAAFEHQAETYLPCNGNFLGTRTPSEVKRKAVAARLTTKENADEWLMQRIQEWKNHENDICLFFIDAETGSIYQSWYSQMSSLIDEWEVVDASRIPKLKRKQ